MCQSQESENSIDSVVKIEDVSFGWNKEDEILKKFEIYVFNSISIIYNLRYISFQVLI